MAIGRKIENALLSREQSAVILRKIFVLLRTNLNIKEYTKKEQKFT